MTSPPEPPNGDPIYALADAGDHIGFRCALARKFGPLVRFEAKGTHYYLVSGPELLEEVMVKRRDLYIKGPMPGVRNLCGEGLITSDGALHARQRRLMQPLFTPHAISPFVPLMAEAARDIGANWQPGQPLDMAREMGVYALTVLLRSLMSDDLSLSIAEVGQMYHDGVRLAFLQTREDDFAELMTRLRGVVNGIVDRHRQEPRTDLVSRLLEARDEGDAGGMSNQQMVDEILTLLFAGHDTTANGLAWAWVAIARDDGLQSRLHEEVDRVLGQRPMTADDMPKLERTRRIFLEVLRLYPPVWIIVRSPTCDVTLGGYDIPAHATIQICMPAIHRSPELYEDPDRFDEDRWLPERVARRHRYAFVPFAAGDRVCLGESLALNEGTAALATFSQKWRFPLTVDTPIEAEPLLTLRPRGGVPVTAELR